MTELPVLRQLPELPVLGDEPPERADAARNRRRILAAAERLFAQAETPGCVSMDAIAAEAGVGKGTLFRRFGDRASLASSLLSAYEAPFQDALIAGPPPLGPGAPPVDRLVAFGEGYLDLVEHHGRLLVEAGAGKDGERWRSAVFGAYRLHVRLLLDEAGCDLDTDFAAAGLLSALQPDLVSHERRVRGVALDDLKAGWAGVVRQLVGQ